ncbi:MAG: two-component sensor histidine kinase [Desulfobacterales bacterium]|nr:two-component sensor histidine kinase [Desulfobacterales bacterium]MBF0395808.1 two-component sensor histidine kinase [Desulfobacterales bacterium]
MVKSLVEQIKPKFWDHYDSASGPFKHLFNFRRIWKQAIIIICVVTLLPIIFLTIVDYNVTKNAVESDFFLRTARFVSNTRRTVSFFLEERRFALDFIVNDNSFESLKTPKRLEQILKNLKRSLGGFSEIEIIDSSGEELLSASGLNPNRNINHNNSYWFNEVKNKGYYISDLFLGTQNIPMLSISIKHKLNNNEFYILRGTFDIERFKELLSQLEVSGLEDAFIINQKGILQTSSRNYGMVLYKIPLEVPKYHERTQMIEVKNEKEESLVIGYAYINDSPFILMVVKHKDELMKPWYKIRFQLIGFIACSILVIIIVILGMSTYLVSNIYMADQKRVAALHQVEYSNKLASIGRLAAGVAHEINNPLAIINEKAGLIIDIFTFKEEYKKDQKLFNLVKSILSSVERCGAITKRLLNFARHMDVSIESLNIEDVINEVLSFLNKEADYRSIRVNLYVDSNIPSFKSDRGKLQQIFLNLVNNAFAAMNDGGELKISAKLKDKDNVSVTISDNGCGISETDIKRVFEPFFTTKAKKGGTGLGLSITYSLVQEIGGQISVKSKVGEGTDFIIILPLIPPEKKERRNNADITS